MDDCLSFGQVPDDRALSACNHERSAREKGKQGVTLQVFLGFLRFLDQYARAVSPATLPATMAFAAKRTRESRFQKWTGCCQFLTIPRACARAGCQLRNWTAYCHTDVRQAGLRESVTSGGNNDE